MRPLAKLGSLIWRAAGWAWVEIRLANPIDLYIFLAVLIFAVIGLVVFG